MKLYLKREQTTVGEPLVYLVDESGDKVEGVYSVYYEEPVGDLNVVSVELVGLEWFK